MLLLCLAGDLGGELADGPEARSEGFYAALYEEPDRLRAEDLNRALQPDHLERLRYTNFPLQAYGALFKWEVLVRDVIEIYRRPWQDVATAHNLTMPDDEDVLRAVDLRPERAIMQNFLWSDDWGETQQLAFEHFEAKARVLESFDFAPADGVLEWLQTLKEYQVPCCCCAGTSLLKNQAEQMLSSAGLADYIDAVVSAEDGCETPEQTYLVSCVKVRRPPERCVVFEDSPRGIVAAHDAQIKAVGVVSSLHNGGDLRHAEMRVSGLDDLSLMSLRDIFKDASPI